MFWSSILFLMPPQLYERIHKWTHEPSPILIIRNTFQTLFHALLFLALIKSENTKTYLLSCNHIENPKTPLPYFFSRILALVYFIASYLFYCICYLFIFIFNTLCLTTTRCSWGRKTTRLFCSGENEESFFDCSPRVQYKTRVSSCGKFTLSTTLCTWSPNEVAHCLVSSHVHILLSSSEEKRLWCMSWCNGKEDLWHWQHGSRYRCLKLVIVLCVIGQRFKEC
jgi:hypothetical protein